MSSNLTPDMITEGVAQGAFELWFQPIVCLQTLEVRGFEGLARWRTDDGVVVAPSQFIDVIEADPILYRSFTDQMIERAVTFAARCREAETTPKISVNLAQASLGDTDLVGRVAALLATHDVPARQLVFEITEREFIDPRSARSEVLLGLSELGVGLAIDDFGTGWSSLETLRWLPVNDLKIDRCFLDQISVQGADQIIVEKVIELGQSLQLLVIAEGIERVDQLDTLRDSGCNLGQGFLFSPAVEPDDAVALAVSGFAEAQGYSCETSEPVVAPDGHTPFSFDTKARCIGEAIHDLSGLGALAVQTLDLVPIPVFMKGVDGRIVWSNESHWSRLGASSRGEVLDGRDLDLHRLDEALRYRYDDLFVMTRGVPIIDRHEVQTGPDGVCRQVRTSKLPVRNRDGVIIGLVGFFVEVGFDGHVSFERDFDRLSAMGTAPPIA